MLPLQRYVLLLLLLLLRGILLLPRFLALAMAMLMLVEILGGEPTLCMP